MYLLPCQKESRSLKKCFNIVLRMEMVFQVIRLGTYC